MEGNVGRHFILGLDIDWERPNSRILGRERPKNLKFLGWEASILIFLCFLSYNSVS